ncbi:hypothetical protein E2C01_066982 [Portunus trituberculatus]|uniref:Uncharacterized protein n=1 Tax=Portunus trituberculatus TaxID=210409 RepID=A0A5B7HJN4_PORTR|nr:hypothetical protein [Portunus trituberculatus]
MSSYKDGFQSSQRQLVILIIVSPLTVQSLVCSVHSANTLKATTDSHHSPLQVAQVTPFQQCGVPGAAETLPLARLCKKTTTTTTTTTAHTTEGNTQDTTVQTAAASHTHD